MIKRIKAAYGKHPDIVSIMAILSAFLIIFAIDMLIVNRGCVWGSDIDWSDQHFTIPEYLRTRYLETGDWSPDFAMQLGAGQNIYNRSRSEYIQFCVLRDSKSALPACVLHALDDNGDIYPADKYN